MVIDVYVNDSKMRLATTVEKQFVDSVKSRGDLDGLHPARYVDGSLLFGGQGEKTQALMGVGSGSGHELAVDILTLLVKDADFETMSKKDFGSTGVGSGATGVDAGPGISKVGKLPFTQETKGSHAERQDGRNAGLQGKKTGCTQDSAISAESCHKIDLVGELRSGVTLGRGVDGEGKIVVDAGSDAAFKNNIDIGVVVVQMLSKTYGILDNLQGVKLGDEQYVSGVVLPVKSEEA